MVGGSRKEKNWKVHQAIEKPSRAENVWNSPAFRPSLRRSEAREEGRDSYANSYLKGIEREAGSRTEPRKVALVLKLMSSRENSFPARGDGQSVH